MRPWKHLLILATGLFAGLLVVSSALGQGIGIESEEGNRLFCDTPAQVEETVGLRDNGLEWAAAIERVNAAKTNACIVLYIRYERLETTKVISTKRGLAEIVRMRLQGVLVNVPMMNILTRQIVAMPQWFVADPS